MRFLDTAPEILKKIKSAAQRRIRNQIEAEPLELEGKPTAYAPREIPEDGLLSSVEFNYEMVALFEELRALYAQLGAIDLTSLKQQNVTADAFGATRAAILKVINDLRVHAFLRKNPEWTTARYVDFHVARNESQLPPLANIDTKTRQMKLARATQETVQLVHPSRGEARVSISHHGGGVSGSLIQDFNPERMLDTSDSTFWADLIVTDEPISQTYTRSKGDTRLCQGLVTEIDVTLAEASTINTIRMLPFAEYPITVIDLAYKESTGSDHWKQIPDFKEIEATLDWEEINFRPVRAAVLRVVFLQENFVKGIYHLPAGMVHATNLLEHSIADSYLSRVGTTGLSSAQVAEVSVSPELLGYLEALKDFQDELDNISLPQERVREYTLVQGLLERVGRVLSKPNIGETIDMLEPAGVIPEQEEEKLIEINTTEYMVGMRTLEVSKVTYSQYSFYASPKFHPGGTPVEISLGVDERHPTFIDQNGPYRLTSVEYEIDLGEGLKYPIHPDNQVYGTAPYVQDEHIELDRHSRYGKTRFLPSNLAVQVRKNGDIVPPQFYQFQNTNGYGELTVTGEFSRTAVYTISYVPETGSMSLLLPALLNSTSLRVPETFDGTDEDARIQTAYIPYVEYSVINNATRFSKRDDESAYEYLQTGQYTVDGRNYNSGDVYEPMTVYVNNVKAKNITDYSGGTQPAFTNTDDDSGIYEYFHVGSNVYFSQYIPDDQITVEYDWMVQHVQVQAKLKCFKQAGVDITPAVDSFIVKLETRPL